MGTESIIEALKASAAQIRDEKQAGANTALRVGSLLLAICEALNLGPDELAKYFLRKDKDDRSKGIIASDKGFEAGTYVKGLVGGSGAWIGADGYGEMSGLTLREFMEVPELRSNRVDVVSGELWNSIAFGLVESVDTESKTCRIKLEENERCGLHVGDFCRGIFADFGNGSNWEGVDECGFLHLYGFWTAYFTPTTIIKNDAGVFEFAYELKPGTTQHPTQSMKFAVYGHPTDTKRQASAYATRTYKRYLNKVDTWVIDPDKHIYAQYGDLTGLTIDGVRMQGYGSFQSNAYFKGVQIQLPPEQIETLKGGSAYGVVLSSYSGTISYDGDGNLVSGNYEVLNVVTQSDGETKNVITDGKNVTTVQYNLTTSVQVTKGSKSLYYSPAVPVENSYTLTIESVGCTASVANGVVVVTDVTDSSNCYVNIYVNCEGMATFTCVYRVNAVHDGKIGKDGEDGVSYRITPNLSTLSKTMTGSIEPESVKFSLYRSKGTESVLYPALWVLEGRNLGSDSWTFIKTSSYPIESYTFPFSGVYRFYRVIASDYNGGGTYMEQEITVVSDGENGKNGEKGASGAMARYRGEFVFYNESDPYVYDKEYRDIVIYEGNVYQVYAFGSSVTDPPSISADSDNDGKWQRASKFRFVAMDTALIDSANIGGFMFKRTKYINGIPVGKLESQYGPVILRDVSEDAAERISATLKIKDDEGVNSSVAMTVIKVKGDIIYKLVPSVSCVKIDADGNMDYNSISCKLYKVTENGETSMGSVPSGYSLAYTINSSSALYTPNMSMYLDGITQPGVASFTLSYNGSVLEEVFVPILKEGSTNSFIQYPRYIQVACNDDGSVKFGLPVRFNVAMYKGIEETRLSDISVSGSGLTMDNERIEMNAETGTLKCTNAVVTGEVNATSGVFKNIKSPNNSFSINEEGTIYLDNGGRIGDFEIVNGKIGLKAGNEIDLGLSSTMALVYNLLSFKDGDVRAAIGSGSYPTSTGVKHAAHFENTTQRESYDSTDNVGVRFDVSGATQGTNIAFYGTGSGVLSNLMCGYGVQYYSPSSGTIQVLSMRKGNYFLINSSNGKVALPSISDVRKSLSIASNDTSTTFAVPITIATNFDITLYGQTTQVSGLNSTSYPEGVSIIGVSLSAGTATTYLLVYCNGAYKAFKIS